MSLIDIVALFRSPFWKLHYFPPFWTLRSVTAFYAAPGADGKYRIGRRTGCDISPDHPTILRIVVVTAGTDGNVYMAGEARGQQRRRKHCIP